MDIRSVMDLVILECKRIQTLISAIPIDDRGEVDVYYDKNVSELKRKMHELRRDTITLEKMMYKPSEYVGDNKFRI